MQFDFESAALAVASRDTFSRSRTITRYIEDGLTKIGNSSAASAR